jgi:4-amino-4-deoxy-L-arabinose transferase-like glycosyltransferase
MSATGWALLYAIASLAVFSPWMIRNVHWTGNPIYPMLQGVFSAPDKSEEEPWGSTSDLAHETGGTVAVHRFVFKEPMWYVALLPLRVFFEGRDDDPRRFDGRLNPFLLLLAPWACFRTRGRRDPQRMEAAALLAFSTLFILIAIFTSSVRVRYLMPAIPPLCALAAMGLHRLVQWARNQPGKGTRWVSAVGLGGVVMVMLGLNFAYGVELFKRIEPLGYLTGQVGREAYITRYRPEYPMVQLANRTVARHGRILALFLGNRRYYFDREVSFSEGILHRALGQSSSVDQVVLDLRGRGFTHLMLRDDLFEWWMNHRIAADERERLQGLLRDRTETLSRERGFTLMALKP